jgi:hypothetical protein
MATTGRTEASAPAASDVAATCRDAGLVRFVGASRGDALAALGVLAGVLDDEGIPYQAGLRQWPDADAGAGDADATIAVGLSTPWATHDLGTSPIETAYAVADELGSPDPVLGLAGLAAGEEPVTGSIHEDAVAAGIERRPGLGIPVADPAEGLAHTTLVHGPFSSDPDAAAATLDEAADGRERASAAALGIGADAPVDARAGEAIQRCLRPHAGGPFETVGGYADVLDALARRDPGLGIARCLGYGDPAEALDVWREHGREVHKSVEGADTRRHDGIVTATIEAEDAVVEPVARLLRDFRAVEPVVLVRGRDAAAVATREGHDAAGLLESARDEGSTPVVGGSRIASIPRADDALESAVREAAGRQQ